MRVGMVSGRRGSAAVGALLAVVLLAATFTATLPGSASFAATSELPGSEDAYAERYHRLLQQHTRWTDTTWDADAGHYQRRDFNFTVVLGHAVLLRSGHYDPQLTGVSRDTLRRRTIQTIEHFAAANRWVDPERGTWGRRIYWDSTFEVYFVAAAKLLWEQLDAQTRDNVNTIIRGAANYALDPANEDRTNGLDGAYRGNSRIEEMGAKSMPLAAAAAYLPDDPAADRWRGWMNQWMLNMGGLPSADEANPARVGGRTVADWMRAHNVYDTFVVENHGSYAPIYQESMGAYPGRNVVHFLIAGQQPPQTLREIPNGDELWATLAHLGTRAGVSAHLMIADRHHLYGRDVLPLAYRTTVLGDRYAARAELMLLDHLEPYVDYPPKNRLTKITGEPKYEPEARAELAMAYLLHRFRDRLAGDARPVSERELFRAYSGATDYGADVGLVAQQSQRALAAAVSKAGYVKFAYLPGHDDWLFDTSGDTPSLLPSTDLRVKERRAHVYREPRDGFDGSATMLTFDAGHAGYTTLPNGQAVYATSGLGEDEGRLRIYNLSMPGVPGLDGDRTFTAAGGSVTLAPGSGDGGVDTVTFEPVTTRYVRVLGARPATGYGYSVYEFEAYAPGSGRNLALDRPTTASSYDRGGETAGGPYSPELATDGDHATRWAVARGERGRADSWLAVDLGEPTAIDRVVLRWEAAYGAAYRIQVSDDGASWRTVASVPKRRTFEGSWLNVDGRAGLVVRGGSNPIEVSATGVVLSSGPASGSAGMVVEARPAESPEQTARAAAAPAPTGGPRTLRASQTGGYLSLFNLGDEPITGARLTVAQDGVLRLYQGTQRTTADGTVYEVSLPGADARVEPPRFTLSARGGGEVRLPLSVRVADSRTVTVRNLADDGVARLALSAVGADAGRDVTVPAGMSRTIHFRRLPLTPVDDLARTRITYPTSPLPDGMTDPDRAVDGDPATAWRPGPAGRMVVDLGRVRALDTAVLVWRPGFVPDYTIAVSADGQSYRTVYSSDDRRRRQRVDLGTTNARYVAVTVEPGHRDRVSGLSAFELYGPGGGASP